MAEELQHLIDRIQKEALEAAESKAGQILARAREQAAVLNQEATAKAAANLYSL